MTMFVFNSPAFFPCVCVKHRCFSYRLYLFVEGGEWCWWVLPYTGKGPSTGRLSARTHARKSLQVGTDFLTFGCSGQAGEMEKKVVTINWLTGAANGSYTRLEHLFCKPNRVNNGTTAVVWFEGANKTMGCQWRAKSERLIRTEVVTLHMFFLFAVVTSPVWVHLCEMSRTKSALVREHPSQSNLLSLKRVMSCLDSQLTLCELKLARRRFWGFLSFGHCCSDSDYFVIDKNDLTEAGFEFPEITYLIWRRFLNPST